jgi:hypothetical protein
MDLKKGGSAAVFKNIPNESFEPNSQIFSKKSQFQRKPIEELILRGLRSSSFWLPRNLSNQMDKASPHQRYSVLDHF